MWVDTARQECQWIFLLCWDVLSGYIRHSKLHGGILFTCQPDVLQCHLLKLVKNTAFSLSKWKRFRSQTSLSSKTGPRCWSNAGTRVKLQWAIWRLCTRHHFACERSSRSDRWFGGALFSRRHETWFKTVRDAALSDLPFLFPAHSIVRFNAGQRLNS